MGIMKLGSKYRKMMKDTRHLEVTFEGLDDPIVFLCEVQDWFTRQGIDRILKTGKGRFSKMATAYRRNLKLPRHWNDFKSWEKGVLLAHERVHYRQRVQFGSGRFDVRYVADPRFLVAMETQAYRESLRVRRLFGESEEGLEKYAVGVSKTLLNSYPTTKMLDPKEVRKHVTAVMHDELANPT